jgi:hypothetical protein
MNVEITDKARSLCDCGHTGDGPNSQHEDLIQQGHGPCRQCDCQRFRWVKFLPEFEQKHPVKTR